MALAGEFLGDPPYIYPFLRFPFVSLFNLFRFLGFSFGSLFLHLDIKVGGAM
jgi:hypothetical protein